MNILGISASPRENGNTQILVNEALKEARSLGAETEYWTAANKDLRGCDSCCACIPSGDCIIEDDVFIGEHTRIGSGSIIRKHSHISNNVIIGTNCEIGHQTKKDIINIDHSSTDKKLMDLLRLKNCLRRMKVKPIKY